MSVAGGLWRAVDHARAVGAQVLQVFTANQRRWEVPRPSPGDAERFRSAVAEWGGGFVASHASYLFNLASPDEDAGLRSVHGLAAEIERCALLGIPWVVLHPGAHLEGGSDGRSVENGVRRAAARLVTAFDAADRLHPHAGGVGVLLENTAGQGTCLGADMAELGRIVDACPARERLEVCIDTAHACAAGYDLATREGYERLTGEVDRAVGLGRVRLFHVNDSATPCGARSDRHAHIGLARIWPRTAATCGCCSAWRRATTRPRRRATWTVWGNRDGSPDLHGYAGAAAPGRRASSRRRRRRSPCRRPACLPGGPGTHPGRAAASRGTPRPTGIPPPRTRRIPNSPRRCSLYRAR